MEKIQFAGTSNIQFRPDFKKQNETPDKNSNIGNISNGESISYEASNALKAQVLYNKSNNQYLSYGLDRKQIIKELKNEEKMGRSFFGQKAKIANTITKADDTKLAVDNFNFLLNAKDKKLSAVDVADILLVATSINNGKIDENLAKDYGFEGGALKEENVESILSKINEQREQQAFILTQQQMMNQQMIDQQMMNQQMMQQDMFNNQMMQQQMMMPGF